MSTELLVVSPRPPVDASMSAAQVPELEPDLMLPTTSMVFVPETRISKLTENELDVEGEAFAVPLCVPVVASTRRRSVMDADSLDERSTTMVFTFMPSVEPDESVNEPSFALFVPAMMVWLP